MCRDVLSQLSFMYNLPLIFWYFVFLQRKTDNALAISDINFFVTNPLCTCSVPHWLVYICIFISPSREAPTPRCWHPAFWEEPSSQFLWFLWLHCLSQSLAELTKKQEQPSQLKVCTTLQSLLHFSCCRTLKFAQIIQTLLDMSCLQCFKTTAW